MHRGLLGAELAGGMAGRFGGRSGRGLERGGRAHPLRKDALPAGLPLLLCLQRLALQSNHVPQGLLHLLFDPV